MDQDTPVKNHPPEQPVPASNENANPDVSWESLKLSQAALDLIKNAGFTKPTPVQAQTIPLAMDGDDVIVSSQTGTGKTASFVLPMVERFAGREGTYGLILSPTREIAQQTAAVLDIFGKPRGVRAAVLIGGVDYSFDKKALDSYPQIIVATPGRLCDHLDRGNVWLEYIQMVILDEADRMLDMGFTTQLNRIMEDVPEQRQTLLFSATIPPSVEKLAHRILYQPKKITIGVRSSANKAIEQRLIWMKEESKNRELRRLIREETGSIIVFTRSKDKATQVWRSLHSNLVYDATYIHSDRLQAHREQALAEFKQGKYRILIATDVAARGLHIDEVAHVVNYDLPMEAENYVHRIGRTGRAGATGKATTFVTSRDRALLRDIEKLLGKSIRAEYADGMGADSQESSGGHGRGGGRSSRQDSQRQEPQRQDPQRQEPQRQDPQRQDPQRQDPPPKRSPEGGSHRVIAPGTGGIALAQAGAVAQAGSAAPGGAAGGAEGAEGAEGGDPARRRRRRRGGRGRGPRGDGNGGGNSGGGSSDGGTPAPSGS